MIVYASFVERSTSAYVSRIILLTKKKYNPLFSKPDESFFVEKILDESILHVDLVPPLVRLSGKWYQRPAAKNKPLTSLAGLTAESYRSGSNDYNFFLELDVVDDKLVYQKANIESKYVTLTDEPFMYEWKRSSNKEKFVPEEYHLYRHKVLGFNVVSLHGHRTQWQQHFADLGPTFKKGIFCHSEKLAALFGSTVFIPADNIIDVAHRLKNNISRSIQYNHWEYIDAGVVKTVLDSTMPSNLIGFLYDEYIDIEAKVNISAHPANEFIPSTLVPKNGEKNAGDRRFYFRRVIDKYVMAACVTAFYRAKVIDTRALGSRLVDDDLIPYIHTYNLYRDEIMKHDCKFTYLDIKDFFNSITPALIEDATAGLPYQQALLDMLARSIPHLTIDSNYEHALATIIVAHLMKDVRCDWRSFVDDIVLFNATEDDIVYLLQKLNSYGLAVNKEKILVDVSRQELKELVFLPVGFRYRDPDVTELRLEGFKDYLKYNTMPLLDAYSSKATFERAFQVREAEWVIENIHDVFNSRYRVEDLDDRNILQYLQYMTLRPEQLTIKDTEDLLLVMELFPSKAKWIMSLLRKANEELLLAYKTHPSRYVRYLAGNKLKLKEVSVPDVCKHVYFYEKPSVDVVGLNYFEAPFYAVYKDHKFYLSIDQEPSAYWLFKPFSLILG